MVVGRAVDLRGTVILHVKVLWVQVQVEVLREELWLLAEVVVVPVARVRI